MNESIKKLLCQLQPLAVSLIFILILLTLRNNPIIDLSRIDGGIILIGLFIIAFVFESKYLPTTWVLPNTIILYILLQNNKDPTSTILNVYLYLGIILTLTAYILCKYKHIKGKLYKATFILYSLKTILPLYATQYFLGSYNHPYTIYAFTLLAIITWTLYAETGI